MWVYIAMEDSGSGECTYLGGILGVFSRMVDAEKCLARWIHAHPDAYIVSKKVDVMVSDA